MNRFPTFTTAIQVLEAAFRHAPIVHTERWQGIDISKKPEAEMREQLFISFQTPMPQAIDVLRQDVKPNLPWADDHFLERISGKPLNPGQTWKSWPWALSADKFREKMGNFSHTYMERYWPKYAGYLRPMTGGEWDNEGYDINCGIRFNYGDLDNIVSLLCKEPLTRQAYMPIFFPEDTGDVHNERKPCTLGYHFIIRGGKFHIVYGIRSCDFVRHFRDDVYLTVRLADWVLNKCREDDATRAPEHRFWQNITLGTFVMHITSLHMFKNDYLTLFPPDKGIGGHDNYIGRRS